ncbi:hypothetical protein B296_00036991 [Ensete ventricosum]|uniref:Uncharacterized protein n=1 Tax=Ensete ventricosum TaxID=4639 RepID=A0A426XVY0_ENSVE|nr:hypothetical protein B296_00036991 [Ensete ventricosum]
MCDCPHMSNVLPWGTMAFDVQLTSVATSKYRNDTIRFPCSAGCGPCEAAGLQKQPFVVYPLAPEGTSEIQYTPKNGLKPRWRTDKRCDRKELAADGVWKVSLLVGADAIVVVHKEDGLVQKNASIEKLRKPTGSNERAARPATWGRRDLRSRGCPRGWRQMTPEYLQFRSGLSTDK